MNDLDMELQTIRQKLQTLKASPPETVDAPWGQSRLASPSPNLAQVTTAIETLRQRSHPSSIPHTPSTSLEQFDAALSTIENLAQQQHQALRQLKILGDHLAQQTQAGISPDVDDIARFFSQQQAVQIPTVQRNSAGYLTLTHHTINFHQIEQNLISRTDTSRMHSAQLFQHPLEQSQETDLDFNESRYTNSESSNILDDISHFCILSYRSIHRWISHYLSTNSNSYSSQFTLLDGTIWCIGSVITRLILHQIFQSYPFLWTPIASVLIGGILLSLYRAFLSPNPKPVLGYRTMIIIVGLLFGGRFL
ncbi:MAG: hypothetical protein F6K11_32435 [Leptolyngbya sp. SIO3F4]|nr:hypothetical protein [Leptolyngbya sp. SIO3F4]